MTDLTALRSANERRWANAKPTGDPTPSAKSLVAAKSRYQTVAVKTGVPWFVIAVIHERESSQNWRASLAQGDPWNRMSIHVPAGRGPFKSWEHAAIDALTECAPYLAHHKDWSNWHADATRAVQWGSAMPRVMYRRPISGGTDQYKSGKFVRDGIYKATVVDKQPGCATLLRRMMQLDPSIEQEWHP